VPLKVFISSEMNELRQVRASIAKSLRSRGFSPWLYEKDGKVAPRPIASNCFDEIDSSDIFVGVFWKRLTEITKAEYLHARGWMPKPKPCFVYIRERYGKRTKELKDFLETQVQQPYSGVSPGYFDGTAKIGDRVTGDIMAWLERVIREKTATISAAPVSEAEKSRLRDDVEALRAAIPIQLSAGTALDYLASQMRGWFEAIGDQIEPGEVRAGDYFEWVVNRQRRGERVLVRGIDGWVAPTHVPAARQALKVRHAEEVWLVGSRGVKSSARATAKRASKTLISCYTFDEVIDLDVDFGRYFSWLDAEIRENKIDRYCLPLACKKGEFRIDQRNGWIEGYLDRWLEDPSKEHVSILGEFGTGKTWLALHYAWRAMNKYRSAKRRGGARPRVPLYIPLRDYAAAGGKVEAFISEFFFSRHQTRLPWYAAFDQLNRMGKLLLVFDGFDEMAARINRQEMIDQFWQLARLVVPGSKALLTCRTEHFPDAKEGRALLRGELKASTESLTGEPPQFEALELERLNKSQIKQILTSRAKPVVVRQVMANPELLELAERPIMTRLILEALPDIRPGQRIDMSRVYLYAVRRQMERDIEARRTFTSLADKLYFLCELFWEMPANLKLNYMKFSDRIRSLFAPEVGEDKHLDWWRADLSRNTMLVRTAEGDYSPAHLSILEFFVAYKLVAELGVLASEFTALARQQSHIDRALPPRDYCWSEYFRRDVDDRGQVKPMAPLRAFATEHGDWSVPKLTRNTYAFSSGMVSTDPASLNMLISMAFEGKGTLASSSFALLPFFKYEHARTLAMQLLERSEGLPLRSGVAWLLGELGDPNQPIEEVVQALKRTADAFLHGQGKVGPWWEAGFALEKLAISGKRQSRQGDLAVNFLIQHLPAEYTIERSHIGLFEALQCHAPLPGPLPFPDYPLALERSQISQADIVAFVKHEREIDRAGLVRMIDSWDQDTGGFSSDETGRRAYYITWLCGHLGLDGCMRGVIRALRHPHGSVRNCAAEALGKMVETTTGVPLDVRQGLEATLKDDYYRARFHAAWSLGELKSVLSTKALTDAINAEDVRDVKAEMNRVRTELLKPRVKGRGAPSVSSGRGGTAW
jgi:hypothetical protein